MKMKILGELTSGIFFGLSTEIGTFIFM